MKRWSGWTFQAGSNLVNVGGGICQKSGIIDHSIKTKEVGDMRRGLKHKGCGGMRLWFVHGGVDDPKALLLSELWRGAVAVLVVKEGDGTKHSTCVATYVQGCTGRRLRICSWFVWR